MFATLVLYYILPGSQSYDVHCSPPADSTPSWAVTPGEQVQEELRVKGPRWPALGSMASGAAGMLRSLGTGLGHLPEGVVDSLLSVGSSLFEGSARDIPSGWMLCVCTPNSSCSPAGLAGPRRDQASGSPSGAQGL